MTWIGGVKRYCPVRCRASFWSWRSSTRVVALPLRLGERFAAAEHEAEPRHALDAFVRRRGHRVERHGAGIERQGAEGAHGVDEEALAVARRERGDLLDRIADAARRLAMHDEHVRDALRALEQALDRGEVRHRVLGRLVHHILASGDVEDALGAVAVSAVDEEQHLAGRRHEGGQHGFHGEGAGALHRHGHEAVLAVDDAGKLVQHRLVDGDEGGVARSPIVDHDLLDRFGRRQRTRRQEQRIAGFGGSAAGDGGHAETLWRDRVTRP